MTGGQSRQVQADPPSYRQQLTQFVSSMPRGSNRSSQRRVARNQACDMVVFMSLDE